VGTGMATEIGYSIPEGSLEFWENRLDENKIKHKKIAERFGEKFIWFEDPDGLQINLIIPNEPDNRKVMDHRRSK
jgi:glyoxalase family protein